MAEAAYVCIDSVGQFEYEDRALRVRGKRDAKDTLTSAIKEQTDDLSVPELGRTVEPLHEITTARMSASAAASCCCA
ncbi:hypothetical protein ACLBYG_31145 [Methylobacterium sp. D53M]|jgi:hypothetical protein